MNGEGDSEFNSGGSYVKMPWEQLANKIKQLSIPEKKGDGENVELRKTWESDPTFFKNVNISMVALLKMLTHSSSSSSESKHFGGLLFGKVDGNTLIVMDSMAFPQGFKETDISSDSFNNYVEGVMQSVIPIKKRQVFRMGVDVMRFVWNDFVLESYFRGGKLPEKIIGWYHSHPGYGCWLNGHETCSQMRMQNIFHPFVAIVIDPTRTISVGKICLGAFRTYPKEYKGTSATTITSTHLKNQIIPLNKQWEFHRFIKSYYTLDVTYFKSELNTHLLDTLWNKYWFNTLSSSSDRVINNFDGVTEQILDITDKLKSVSVFLDCDGQLGKQAGELLSDAKKDASILANEIIQNCTTQVMKNGFFNQVFPKLDK